MATTADIRNGMCIKHNGQLYSVVEILHVKPGKGADFVRTKLKNITTGRVVDNTFNAGFKLEEVRIQRSPYQYLYKDESGYIFMHNETFEQVIIEKDSINGWQYLKEGDICEVMVKADDETVLYADVPTHVILEITYTEPGLKGDTSTNSLKPATVDRKSVV